MIAQVLQILIDIIFPIFLIIGVGMVLDRKLELDQDTLSALNFYVFVPALLFVKIIESDLAVGQMGKIVLFTLGHAALLYGAARLIFSAPPFRDSRTTLTLGALFYNAGNYGIPLTLLAFGEKFMGQLAAVLMVQNLLCFTVGVGLLEKDLDLSRRTLGRLIRIPVIPAIALALAMQGLGVNVPEQLAEPLTYLADGLVPVALLTLGVQLSRCRLTSNLPELSAISGVRLVLSPLLAAGLALLMGFSGTVTSFLIVVAGLPVAVNVYILSAKYRQNQDLASQFVFWTTLVSVVTITMLLTFFR
ncbi:MAG: AEC family transporter [Candidatus Brocadiia bacterium]